MKRTIIWNYKKAALFLPSLSRHLTHIMDLIMQEMKWGRIHFSEALYLLQRVWHLWEQGMSDVLSSPSCLPTNAHSLWVYHFFVVQGDNSVQLTYSKLLSVVPNGARLSGHLLLPFHTSKEKWVGGWVAMEVEDSDMRHIFWPILILCCPFYRDIILIEFWCFIAHAVWSCL